MLNDIYHGILSGLKRAESVPDEISITNRSAVSATSYHLDDIMVACQMANGTLLNDIWKLKTGRRQKITIDHIHVALAYLSFFLVFQDGNPLMFQDRHRTWPYYPIMDAYRTRDGRHVFITGVYPSLRDGILDFLNCPNNKDAIGNSILQWDAEELESQLNAKGLCGVMVRTHEEWRNHPQGKVLNGLPLISLDKVGETAAVPFGDGTRPLSGIKVLDLTHLLAGPVATRTLAEYGAEVLHISGPKVEELFPFVADTGHGKRNTFLDLENEYSRLILSELIQEADVFVGSYAPGKLEKLGFGPAEIHRINPKAIYVNVSAFGHQGPWASYKGFEQTAQAACGLMLGHSSMADPKLLPAAACDYLTGYLCSLGILSALYRRAQEGGSYLINLSLVRTGMWIEAQGHREGRDAKGVLPSDFNPYLAVSESPYGSIKHLKPVLQLDETPAFWEVPLSPLGSSLPTWNHKLIV